MLAPVLGPAHQVGLVWVGARGACNASQRRDGLGKEVPRTKRADVGLPQHNHPPQVCL